MAKANPLTKALKASVSGKKAKAATVEVAPEVNGNGNGKNGVAPSRVGRVIIGGHFMPDVQTQLKIIAATERRSIQSLLGEALDLLFVNRGKPAIAAEAKAE